MLITAPLLLLLATSFSAGFAVADDCVKPEWKVEGVRLPQDPTRAVDSYVELGDMIAVTSANLAELRKCAKANDPVLLYLNGMPLKGMLEFPPRTQPVMRCCTH
jgi:hypothetical protein